MKRVFFDFIYGIVGVALLIGSAVLFHLNAPTKIIIFTACFGLSLLLIFWVLLYQDSKEIQSRREYKIAETDLLKSAVLKRSMPFEQIRTNFLILSKRDDTVVADKDFLSWDSGSFADIRIMQLDKGNWICKYWIRASWVMKDAVMETICEINGIRLPAQYRGMEPHGIAIYSNGSLQIYPSILQEEFKNEFLDTVLSLGSDFEKWVKDYYEEE